MHGIIVENQPAITAFQATAAKEFEKKTVKRVHVTDGRLTSRASGGDASINTKINYLHISPSDVTAPAAPANLAAVTGDSTVGLTWDAVTASDLAGYHVYRSTSSTVALTAANRLTDEPISARAYPDNDVINDETYHYVVTAIDNEDNESEASETESATPADRTPPAVPTNLQAIAGDAKVSLTWTPSTATDFAGYRIYRSTTSPVVLGEANFVGASHGSAVRQWLRDRPVGQRHRVLLRRHRARRQGQRIRAV